MTFDPEQESNERLKTSIEGISSSVFNDLMQEHDVDLTEAPNLKDSLFAGYSRQEMEATLREIGLNVVGGLGPASVMTLPYESGARQIDQILWLDTAHPALKGLGDFTDYSFERHQHGFLIVAEEVSHLLYKDQYYKKHGVEPPDWLTEMVGAMDKYNLLQKMYLQRHGRVMNSQEEQRARGMIFTALDAPPGGAPPEHAVGHTQAYHLVNQLNRLASTGRQQEASRAFTQIYTGSERQVRQMLPQPQTQPRR